MKRIILLAGLLLNLQALIAMERPPKRMSIEQINTIKHTFLNDHETFKNLYQTRARLPLDLSKLLAQMIITPAIKLACQNVAVPYKVLKHKDRHVDCAKFNPAGTAIVSGTPDGLVHIWDVASGKEIQTIKAHEHGAYEHGQVLVANFSPNGQLIITGSSQGTAKVWNLQDGSCLFTANHPSDKLGSSLVTTAAFNSSDTELVTASRSGFAYIFTNWAKPGTPALHIKAEKGIAKAMIQPHGKIIALGLMNGNIVLWDFNKGECLKQLEGHTGCIDYVHFNPDGTLLASAAEDKTVKIWDINTGKCIHNLTQHQARVLCAEFDSTGAFLSSTDTCGNTKIWDVSTGTCLRTLDLHTCLIHMTEHRDDQWFARTTSKQVPARVRSASFSPDGKRLATASHDYTVRIWDLKDFMESIEFLKKSLTLEQALLINLIFETAQLNKLCEKRTKNPITHQLDFSKFEHLKTYFQELPEPIQNALKPYIKQKEEGCVIF